MYLISFKTKSAQVCITNVHVSGTCAVLITNNGTQRSLCANLAAANHFTVDHIQLPENKKLIEAVDFVYVSVSILGFVCFYFKYTSK